MPAQSHRLQIISNRLVTSIFAGAYKSVFRGRGIEFEELCDYQPGDDIRCIDWNVTARTGHTYIKRFVEERELTVMLMLDRSLSLDCPSSGRSKSAAAAELFALLISTACRSNDRIGLLTFGSRVERFVPPAKGLRHARRLIDEMVLPPTAAGRTDINTPLDYLQRVSKRPLILFIVSDFVAPDFSAALTFAARRHDLIAVNIRAPFDDNLPDVGLLQVADAESGRSRLIDTGAAKVRTAYSHAASQRQAALRQTVAAAGAELLSFSTTTPPLLALNRFFQNRQRRQRA